MYSKQMKQRMDVACGEFKDMTLVKKVNINKVNKAQYGT